MNAQAIVAEALELSGLSKAELARRSGISRSSLDEYVQGKRQPSVGQLERLGESAGLRLEINWAPIAVQFRKDPAWLMPDNPDMRTQPTSRQQRAAILEMVIPVAMETRRRERSAELDFPPFKQLAGSSRD